MYFYTHPKSAQFRNEQPRYGSRTSIELRSQECLMRTKEEEKLPRWPITEKRNLEVFDHQIHQKLYTDGIRVFFLSFLHSSRILSKRCGCDEGAESFGSPSDCGLQSSPSYASLRTHLHASFFFDCTPRGIQLNIAICSMSPIDNAAFFLLRESCVRFRLHGS